MAHVRTPDELRDRVKKYVRESGEYDTISEFVKDAIRRLLDEKEETYTKEDLEKIIDKKVEEELG